MSSMDPAFILAAAPKPDLPGSSPLNLLPFSLGPGSAPYASTSAPISQYFQPRPCPADIPGVPEGTPIAAFRGRQLVGQQIRVPRGYSGIVLSASARPEMGFEHRDGVQQSSSSSSLTKDGKWPLTPASSVASAGSSIIGPSTDGDEADGSGRSLRKSTRVRGAGQVALARPKRRGIPRQAEPRKRIKLDSDDEEEDGSVATLNRSTAPGRADRETTPASSAAGPSTASVTPVKPSVPTISVQEPTPRKDPAPTPRRSLRRTDRTADFVLPGVVKEQPKEEEDAATGPVTDKAVSQGAELKVEAEEQSAAEDKLPPALNRSESAVIIPSPATEDDPPDFDIGLKPEPTVPSVSVTALTTDARERGIGGGQAQNKDEEQSTYDGPVRVLRPTSTFSSFMLWTPDAPLAGFRPDAAESTDTAGETKEQTGAVEAGTQVAGDDGEVKARSGWWRHGGGGEGGDEVVRALGEWLGLVETINKPLYLDDAEDSDDDE